MHKGTITFLYDGGQAFTEVWDFEAASSEEAMQCLERVASARLGLLAPNVRIVGLAVPGCAKRQVRLRGTGGTRASTREGLSLVHDQQHTVKNLRGFSSDMIEPDTSHSVPRWLPLGQIAFDAFNQVLADNGCMIVGAKRPPERVQRFELSGRSVLSYRKDELCTLEKLKRMLGTAEAEAFWAELKNEARKDNW